MLKIGTWPSEPMRLSEDHIDDLLMWCVQQKSGDTTLQSDRPVYIEVDGILFPVTRRPLDSADMANVLSRIYGADALAKLASGCDLDLSYEVRPDRNTRVRFRVNITAILSRGRDSVQVTLRTLPSLPPTFKELGISLDLESWYGLMGPSGLSTKQVDKLANVVQLIMRSEETKKKVESLGINIGDIRNEAFARMIEQETAIWQKVANQVPATN